VGPRSLFKDIGELLTLKETARLLQVSPRTVWRWCRTGQVAAVKIGREWRIRERDVRALVTPPRPARAH
jgi:excisionase family DNA binding protein